MALIPQCKTQWLLGYRVLQLFALNFSQGYLHLQQYSSTASRGELSWCTLASSLVKQISVSWLESASL